MENDRQNIAGRTYEAVGGAGSSSCARDIRLHVRRNLLGLIAIVFLGFAALICLTPSLVAYQPAGLMGLRIGMVLAALWLAWPDLQRLPRWTWFAMPIGLIVVICARGALVYVLPSLATALAIYLVYRRLRRPA